MVASDDVGGNAAVRLLLSAAVLALFMVINLAGARMTGTAEDLVVYTKIAILGLFAVAGLIATRESAGIPRFDQGRHSQSAECENIQAADRG